MISALRQMLAASGLCLALGLTVAGGSAAQEVDSTASIQIGATHAIAGFTKLDLTDLNARLAGSGLPGLASGSATTGFAADLRTSHLLLSGEWQTIFARNARNASYRARLSGDAASLDAGLLLLRRSRGTLSATTGIGATHIVVRIDRRGDFSFEDGLSDPRRGMELTGTTFVYRVGVGGEWRPAARSAFALTARVGIMRSAGAQRWSAESDDVAGGPGAMRGFQVTVGISRPLHQRRGALLPMAGSLLRIVSR